MSVSVAGAGSLVEAAAQCVAVVVGRCGRHLPLGTRALPRPGRPRRTLVTPLDSQNILPERHSSWDHYIR